MIRYTRAYISQLYLKFRLDPLYRNSIFLILSTAVMSLFGFVFWLVCARLFNAGEVGIATSLISITSLITGFSLMGMGNSLIKYLPSAADKKSRINTAVTIVSAIAVLISLIFLIFADILSPKLSFVRANSFYAFLFIFFTLFYALNVLMDDIYTALRSTGYVFLKNFIFSFTKLVLPLLLSAFGSFGIYASFGVGSAAALFASFYFLMYVFRITYTPHINLDDVRLMARFSLGNYLANFIGTLPSLILPVIIVTLISAKQAAYYYMVMMIANLLYVIPFSISQSLFAEGSHISQNINIDLKRSVKLISAIITPAILALLITGRLILNAFGQDYADNGYSLLAMLAVNGLFVSINYIGETILKLFHKIKLLIIIKMGGMITILLFTRIFINQGLEVVGIAWLTGNILLTIIYFAKLPLFRKLIFG